MRKQPELIVASDLNTIRELHRLVDDLGDTVEWYKVGKQMFTRYGPEIVTYLKDRKKKVFLDLKFHDIPNTVANAVISAIGIGADMVNVHGVGGAEMMRAAADKVAPLKSDALLIAVTVLTSMDSESFAAAGYAGDIPEQVQRLARTAQDCGFHGVVASAQELAIIRETCGEQFLTVVPGVRPANADAQDQKRTATPAAVSKLGANFIVVGRPITQAPNPKASATAILAELGKN